MSAVLYILLAWLLTIATCLALGAWAQRLLRLSLEGPRVILYRFLLGSLVLSLLMFLLASLGLIYKGTSYAIAAIAILSRYRDWPAMPRPRWHWSFIPFASYFVFYLAHAMAPEHSPDGMSYHLGLVARYYREHGFVWFPTNMYAFLSQGLEMLFLFAFAIGRHSGAAMVHFTFLLLIPAFLAMRAGIAGWLAGLIVFFLPVVGIDGISAYNDVALAVVLFAIWDAVEQWRDTREAAWVSTAALLCGFAFAIKFTGVIGLALLYPTWRLWPRWSFAALCALPWLLKSYAWSGNPFAPFFNHWFPNPWFSAEFESGYRSFLRHYDLSGSAEWFREVFIGGPRLSGTLGPVGLALPLGLLAFRTQPSLAIAAVLMLVVYPLNVGTRFLIPALPFLSLGVAVVLPRLLPVLAVAAAILSWPDVFMRYASPYTWFLERIPYRAALRIESEDGFLVRKSGGYVTARAIEQFVPPGETVFALSPIPESYTSRNIIVAYQSTIGLKLQQAISAPLFADYQSRFVFRCPGPDLVIEKSTPDTWSITEIQPTPTSITCNRNPWDVHLALDGNWLSRWRTWAPTRKGDACHLSPARPYEVWGTGDQWEISLAGCVRSIEPRELNYREAARQFFLSQNVRYLAIDAPDYPAKDMRDHPQLWPVTLIAERGTMRIYRFNN